ncbi:MAG: hypothetical protein WBV47_00700 [Salegentibacter sp.]
MTYIVIIIAAVLIYFLWFNKTRQSTSKKAKGEDFNPEFASKPDAEKEMHSEGAAEKKPASVEKPTSTEKPTEEEKKKS